MHNDYLDILKREIVPALGCTEPIAVALAVTKSREALGLPVDFIDIKVSGNVLKNAMGVGIPGTGMVGLEIASALGCAAGNSAFQLEVLRDITPEDITRARQMVLEKKVKISVKDTPEKLYIEARCISGENFAVTIIQGTHTNITSICRNDTVLYHTDEKNSADCFLHSSNAYENLTLDGIYAFVTQVAAAELEFLQTGIDMNNLVAEEGLRGNYGLNVGKHLFETLSHTESDSDLATYVTGWSAAACDARMSGCTLPVMSTAGSGNQGITATLPVAAMAYRLHSSHEMTLRAVALSQLVTIHIKQKIGKLSALCGCAIAASVGSSCGFTYLQGGTYEQITYAVKNMIADISGLICDGAKSSCALKISTGIAGAIKCANLALKGVVISSNEGIINDSLEATIANLGKLSTGMVGTDQVILNMMLCK